MKAVTCLYFGDATLEIREGFLINQESTKLHAHLISIAKQLN